MCITEVLLSFPIMFFLLALFSHLFSHSRLVYLICLGVVAVQLSHLPRKISDNSKKVMENTKVKNFAVGCRTWHPTRKDKVQTHLHAVFLV